mmetsp:Transcript_35370/g.59610  ORF Transcript_35370/g.59610 Transcript_35370/m.59610 type:complete len:709 (-) Transcript_35370:156-2282(-)
MGDFLLKFEAGTLQEELIAYVSQRLNSGFDVEAEKDTGLVTVRLHRAELELEAHMKYRKKAKDEEDPKLFDIYLRDDFEDVDTEEFFLPCEKAHLTQLALNKILVDEAGCELIAKAEAYKSGSHGDPHHKRATPLFLTLRQLSLLELFTPLHSSAKGNVFHRFLWYPHHPVQRIRDYYGEEVAFYFAWLNHFTMWLVFPSVTGLGFYLGMIHFGLSVDNNPYLPIFSFGVVIWATLFTISWQRKSNEWAFKWGTFFKEATEEVRPEFKGVMRRSEVTGAMEPFYPDWRRGVKYIVSAAATIIMCTVAFHVMIASLNLQGYIQGGVFFWPVFAQFSAPGGVFNPETCSTLLCLAPTIIHVVSIVILNQVIWRTIATALTGWENHRTEAPHENSLILKRFLFEAFDGYISLFYLAFYELSALKVRTELVSFYTMDAVRRLVTETLIPIATIKLKSRLARRALNKVKSITGEKAVVSLAGEDALKEGYEQFDDYLEMVLEFGYITMFASAMPIASLVSILYNFIEMQSDATKLTVALRRPPSVRARGIGIWQSLLLVQTFAAALTNVLIFGLSSDQMEQWVPSWFTADAADESDGMRIRVRTVASGVDMGEEPTVGQASGFEVGGAVADLRKGKEGNVLLMLFGLEHLLLVAMLCLLFLIPTVPGWIRTAIRRRKFEEDQELAKMKHGMREVVKIKHDPLQSSTGLMEKVE